MFLITLVMEIGGKPTPEISFLPGQFRWTFFPKEIYGDSLRGRGLNHTTFQLRGGYWTSELSPPQRNVRRQCLGVRWCYDVPLRCC